jgi:chaperone required for assembly of F1-ATPase
VHENPEEREKMMQTVRRILSTDAALHRVDSPRALQKLQSKHWNPPLDWLHSEYMVGSASADVHFCSLHSARADLTINMQLRTIQVSLKPTEGILAVNHSPRATKRMEALINAMNHWDFAVFDAIMTLSKSVTVAYGVFKRQVGSITQS